MSFKVIKRNGTEVPYDSERIKNAVLKAGYVKPNTIDKILSVVEDKLNKESKLSVEDIQNIVETVLMQTKSTAQVAKDYIRYRHTRELIRDTEKAWDSILDFLKDKNEFLKTENSNKNTRINSTQRDYIAGEVSKDISKRLLFSKDIVDAHEEGVIHLHDLDYFIQKEFNCCLVNLEDILQNGTVINGTMIEKPHSFSTACNIATQVAAIVASNQYGGQTMSLSHLAPFVDISRQNIRAKLKKENAYSIELENVLLMDEIARGIQMIQYQINTLNSSNGQTPFITIFAYLNETKNEQEKHDLYLIIKELFKQRIKGVKNEQGVWTAPAFPKIIYVLEEDNITEDSPYWDLTELAAECSAKRLVPDYISEKKMIEYKGYCFPCMGCRSFLSPWFDKNGNPKFYGRFNQGVVTLNLPYIALLANEEAAIGSDGLWIEDARVIQEDKIRIFWDLLNKYLTLAHRALQTRHSRLLNTPVESSPLHWMFGGISRLPKGSNINELLFGGYSSISLGYAGLYETVMALIGKSHTTEEGKELAIAILQKLNDATEEWKEAENIGYGVYGSPIESVTYKFAKANKKRFGVIPEITEHDYVTNSYHVCVREPIDPFTKLDLEADFQKLSLGGCISYIETANLQNNIPAVLEVIKHIYDNIMYAELNTKVDYCQVCGSHAEMQIIKDGDKLVWQCSNCGNRDQNKMNVTRRTCGYLGTNFWSQGRTEEIKDRYVHLGANESIV